MIWISYFIGESLMSIGWVMSATSTFMVPTAVAGGAVASAGLGTFAVALMGIMGPYAWQEYLNYMADQTVEANQRRLAEAGGGQQGYDNPEYLFTKSKFVYTHNDKYYKQSVYKNYDADADIWYPPNFRRIPGTRIWVYRAPAKVIPIEDKATGQTKFISIRK